MKLSVPIFKGEAPRVSPRALPDGMAVAAVNARLLSGDLQCYRNFAEIEALCKGAGANTIYPLRDPADANTIYWLHWTDDELGPGAVEVDVAKSTIAGDTTGRVYLTGLDIPRYTNVALATGGSGCYPNETRPLGVGAPDQAPSVDTNVAAIPPIDITDDFDTVASNWTFVPTIEGTFVIRRAEQLSSGGNPLGRIQFTAQETTTSGSGPVYAYRDCQLGNSATFTLAYDYLLEAVQAGTGGWANYQSFSTYVLCDAQGNGPRLTWQAVEPAGSYQVALQTGSTWGGVMSSTSQQSVTGLPPTGSWVRVTITGQKQTANLYTLRIIVSLGSTELFNEVFTNVAIQGGYVGMAIPWSLNADRGATQASIDNFSAQGSAPAADTSDDVATSYVYTFINDIGEESAPSPASATIIRDDGTVVTVTTPTSPPTGIDYFVVSKRIYRAVTGNAGTSFLFVAEIPLAQADYDDSIADADLGEELASSDWDLPPTNLRGILALPNNIYAGFVENQLCLSAQGFPHAWPVTFRLSTDEPVVAIGNVDATVIIMTTAYCYLAAGSTPDTYAMTKLELPQGCVSKRGVASLAGYGIIFPSPDGLVSVAGTGQMQLVTRQLFAREEWQALVPATLNATAHDDRYFGFYEAGGDKKGLMIEAVEGGQGKVTLAFHATAVYADPLTDRLFLVLDENDPPVISGSNNQVVPDGATIWAFDAYEGGSPTGLTPFLPVSWLGKIYQLPHPIELEYAQLKSLAYGNQTLVFYADGASYYTKEITGVREFRLPRVEAATTYQVQIVGDGSSQDVATQLEVAEDPLELA